MGNRAVITTRKDLKDIGVYLHWNGGRDSVETDPGNSGVPYKKEML